MSELTQRYFGKYRGIVTDNTDPLMQGRIRAQIPSVLGDEQTGWALPCSPYGGDGVGFFFIPPVGANVWIEFENGDLDFPIWVGCFWNTGKVPSSSGLPIMKVIKTDNTTITFDDTPGVGGITIETQNGLKIKMDVSGIELNNNGTMTIKLTPASVSVNDGALEVI